MIKHRTQALATVFLTGRNNVDVISVQELGGLDMLCRILTDEDDAEMVFGVLCRKPIRKQRSSHYV
jgi:hypothetical protein